MQHTKILLTGATGETGRAATKLLLERGHSVRALVHSVDARSEALQKAGAEVFQGDLLDFNSVRTALEGTRAAYFVFPIEPGIVRASAYFAQAAKEVGVEVIVNMSQVSARRDAKSHAAQDHWIAERVFDWSGVPVVHLHPTLFAEWLLYWSASIKAGMLPLPFEKGHHAPIAAEDQGRVIAAVLANPAEHIGQTYSLYGAQEMTFPQIAAEVPRLIGKPVEYKKVDVPTMRAMSGKDGPKYSDFLWQHFTEIAIDYENGVFAGAQIMHPFRKDTNRYNLLREFWF